MNSSERKNTSNVYSGFALIRYGRTAAIEMIVLKEEVNSHRLLKTGGTTAHAGPYEKGPGWVRRHGPELSLGFSRERVVEAM